MATMHIVCISDRNLLEFSWLRSVRLLAWHRACYTCFCERSPEAPAGPEDELRRGRSARVALRLRPGEAPGDGDRRLHVASAGARRPVPFRSLRAGLPCGLSGLDVPGGSS